MYQQEKIKPYNTSNQKGEEVEQMFNKIAPTYDFLNHFLSFGVDKYWRKKALQILQKYEPKNILDVATGTGDLALMAYKILKPDRIIGIDLSEGMLEVGRKKIQKERLEDKIELRRGDALNLDFEDESFDAVMVAYGVRNFADLEKGLQEMLRVLKSQGHLVFVELTAPHQSVMKQLFKIYAYRVMPFIGKLFAKDKNAYTYLPQTMSVFPQGEIMKEILEKVGYTQVRFKRFTFGINTLYIATKQ